MREEDKKNGLEQLASHRIHGVLPKKYHMRYRSGQEQLVEEKSLQELEEMIRGTSAEMEVPEGLLPENMKRKLVFYQQKKKKRRHILMGVCVLLLLSLAVLGILAWKNRGLNQDEDPLQQILSYDQLHEYYTGLLSTEQGELFGGVDGAVNLQASLGAGAGDDATASMGAASSYQTSGVGGYISTNLREKEVGEGDYSVTDGKYLYTVSNQDRGEDTETGLEGFQIQVTIHQLDGETVKETAKLKKDYTGRYPMNAPTIYVYQDVLALMYTECRVDNGWEKFTNIEFYDISDRSEVKLLSSQKQNGEYRECRESDGYLYVVSTTSNILISKEKGEHEERYVPLMNGEKLEQKDIYLQKDVRGNAYEMVSSWDLSHKGEMVDVKALVGMYQDIYMTREHVYFFHLFPARTRREEETDTTQISKLSCHKGNIKVEAFTRFAGSLGDSFAIQESGEELWVTVPVNHYEYYGKHQETWRDVSVYTFDKNLEEIDHLKGLARGERISAVRYIGQTGYFVSYKVVDPLISVDFSDSSHLRVLDELTLPGVSQYLHPVQDDLLLGVGRENNNTEGDQLKLDLYDISDPKKLSRMQKELLDADWYECSVFKNYRWILVDEENQLVGFSATNGKGNPYYYLYHYDRQEGLELVKKVEIEDHPCQYYNIWKGFRVGEYLYLVQYQSRGETKIQIEKLDL